MTDYSLALRLGLTKVLRCDTYKEKLSVIVIRVSAF